MTDPIRKPRKLRFRVGTALLVSAPLLSWGCGDDPVVNTVAPPIVQQAQPPRPTEMKEPTMAPTGPIEPSTNVVAPPPPPAMVNVVERPEPPPATRVHPRTNVAPMRPSPTSNVPIDELLY